MSDPDQTDAGGRLESLGRWSGTAFLVAGAFLIGFVGRNAVLAFGGGFSPQLTQLLYVAFVVPAMLAAYAGLFGLYPRLADGSPWLARAGAGLVAVATVAVVGFALSVFPSAVSGATEPSALNQLLWLVMLASTVLGFVVFGIASIRTDGVARTLGLVLLGPPTVYVIMFVSGILLGPEPPLWSTFLISAVQASAHLAVGVVLRGDGHSTGSAEPVADSAA